MEENRKKYFGIEWRTRYFMKVMMGLSVFSIIVFILLLIGNNVLASEKKKAKMTEEKNDPFQFITLEAKSVFVWDVTNGRSIFEKNANTELPLASLTKIMTALTLQKLMPDSKTISISSEHLSPEGDSGLVVGDSWRVENLRDFTLLTSSNDGSLALAASAIGGGNIESAQAKFVKSMNDTARQVGLTSSRFFNEHGLDKSLDRGGAYGSARDVAMLVDYILKNYPDLLEATRYENLTISSAEKIYSANNTNTVVDQIPGLIASKTGFTDLAGGNLVIAYDAGLNRPIIISVLGSSQEGRFEDTLKLIQASQEYIKGN